MGVRRLGAFGRGEKMKNEIDTIRRRKNWTVNAASLVFVVFICFCLTWIETECYGVTAEKYATRPLLFFC